MTGSARTRQLAANIPGQFFPVTTFIAACSFLVVLPCLEWNGWGSIWEISSNKLMNYVLYSKVYPKNVISSTTVWNAAMNAI